MKRRLGQAADALGRVGLAAAGFALYQRLAALRAPPAPGLPPPYLRVLTAGDADPAAFVHVGEGAAREVLTLARSHGIDPGEADAVLDFGCGCGRVARPLAASIPAALHGCDVNPALIGWSQANLAGEFRRTASQPPLPYADGAFALVYALSVFTHLHDPQLRGWLAELARVTRRGGIGVLSLFDEDTPAASSFRPELLARGFVVRREGPEGSNLLCGYVSRAGFAERAAPGWEAVQFVPAAESATGQAVAVLRRA
jgi:SAM-dependent methyltransferase